MSSPAPQDVDDRGGTAGPGRRDTAGPGRRDTAGPGRHDTAGLGRQDVAHLARLARLSLREEELDAFAGQLSAVLDAVAQVGRADVADVPPTTHAVPLTNVSRPDVVTPSLPRDVVLAQAPAAEDDRFRVPQILGEEE